MRRSLVSAGLALVAVAAAGSPAAGQGSMVLTHGSCATAQAQTQVADPCDDGSAVLFNPAALASQRSVVGLGWSGITTGGGFTYDAAQGGATIEREDYTSSVPYGFASYRISERLAAGIGVFNPYGLRISWPMEFEGRFISYETDLKNIYIQPTLAYALSPRLSLGAGVAFIRSSLEINQRADLATTPLPLPGAPAGTTGASLGVPFGTDFADIGLEGTGSGVAYHLAALARITDNFSVGARYLSGTTIDIEGDADFSPVATGIRLPAGNPISQPGNAFGLPAGSAVELDQVLAVAAGSLLTDQGVETSLPVPAQLVVGAAFRPIPALSLRADYQFTEWSSWEAADIDFLGSAPDQTLVLDYQDTHTYRLGGELMATPALALRAGFIYNTAAQKEFSVSALLPEAERNYYSAGLGYRLTDAFSIDAAYQLVLQSDRRGRVRSRPADLTDTRALEALNVGVYSADVSLFNLTLAYRFGSRR